MINELNKYLKESSIKLIDTQSHYLWKDHVLLVTSNGENCNRLIFGSQIQGAMEIFEKYRDSRSTISIFKLGNVVCSIN